MEKLKIAYAGPMSPLDAVPFGKRADLLTDKDAGNQIGYTIMPDGTGYVSDITKLPGVTAKMLDWYFAWRGAAAENDKKVNPKENVSAQSMQGGKLTDEDLYGPEKYWDTTQTVIRIGTQGPETEYQNFKCPSDVGFDMNALAESDTERLVCIRGYAQGQPPKAGPDYFLLHQILNTEDGVEVRTKYWIGWTVRYGKDYKQLPDDFRMPPVFAMERLIKTMKEWANLAAVLPGIYEAENA